VTTKFFPEALYERGFTDLISVTPPGAQLTPSSKIAASQLGKVPGHRLPNGLWAGYDWRKVDTSLELVRKWCIDGANIGLRADKFPAVDIDCTDAGIAQIIEEFALGKLGAAPVRVGRAPKRLLMYRTTEPFTRMRLWIKKGEDHHLVEFLGQGQQYLVHGTHPGTLKPYEWKMGIGLVDARDLAIITREQAVKFMDELKEYLEMCSLGVVTREGDGRPESRVALSDQKALHAPSLELLQKAVALIPNTNDLFASRTEYIRMGIAIRAACGDNEEEGFDIFASWAERWEGNERIEANDPDVVRADWRRFKGPYAVGWSWIAEQARAFGFNDAAMDFDAIEERPTDLPQQAPELSDQWLADEVVRRQSSVLRYVPQRDCYIVWSGGRWKIDAELLAEDIVKRTLRTIANEVMRQGATEKELAQSYAKAVAICSAGKATAVAQLARSDRSIAVSTESLDHDAWILNTPGGIIDLKTGKLEPANPDALCTRATTVPADFGGDCPLWRKFLAEATGGDRELEYYLQRFLGYSLTGSIREQQLTFLWGKGGNGKGVFIDTVSAILGDYHEEASMDTFTESYNEKHSTDVAGLAGARLVTASETEAGKRWDEQRVKSLTGGGLVKARFMRQDFFTFKPQFKLLFAGNHKPIVRDIDDAMKRRLQLVPFVRKPKVVDTELVDKLRAEWPAILAWMVEGCLEWQKQGLLPPTSVRAFSDEYFEDEDTFGAWMRECVEQDESVEFISTTALFQNWEEWANRNGEKPGGIKRFVSALGTRLERAREKTTRRAGFKGVRVNRMDLEAIA
jgi:P4 family phage/plasmid primase-like protien